MGGECLRPRAARSSRVWWGYPAATPGAVAGVTAPTARRGRYRAADGRGRPIERACSARLGRTGLSAQQGCRVPRAGVGGRPDDRRGLSSGVFAFCLARAVGGSYRNALELKGS